MTGIEKAANYIGSRIVNLADMVTSKKVLVGSLAVCSILYVAELPKIIAIGCIGLGYVVIQGMIDIKKTKKTK